VFGALPQQQMHFGCTKSPENASSGHKIPVLDLIWWKPWMPLVEPLGRAEPLLKHAALGQRGL